MTDTGEHEGGLPPEEEAGIPESLAGPPPPRHRGYWMAVQREHLGAVAWGVGITVALAAGIVAAVWWVLPGARPEPDGRGARNVPTIPSESPTPALPATPAVPTSAAVTTSSPGATAAPVATTRAPLLAYRKDGAVWVAGEHERSGGKTVLGSEAGPFALSPDGLGLAVADTGAGGCTVIDLVTERVHRLGNAAPMRPVWSPDSRWLVFGRLKIDGETAEIVRVDRDGANERALTVGVAVAVPPTGDGVVLSAGTAADPGDLEWYPQTGAPRVLRREGRANSIAAGRARVFYATTGVTPAHLEPAPEIRSVDYRGIAGSVLVGAPRNDGASGFDDLTLSPDGSTLAYDEVGDDGFSRVYCVPVRGGTPTLLSVRRDGYLLGWSADGSEVVFVEGNALAGEPTKVMGVRRDGTLRRTIVEGGGL